MILQSIWNSIDPALLPLVQGVAGNWLTSLLNSLPVKINNQLNGDERQRELRGCIEAVVGVFADRLMESVSDVDTIMAMNADINEFLQRDDICEEWVKLIDPKADMFPDLVHIKMEMITALSLNRFKTLNLDATLQDMVEAYRQKAENSGHYQPFLTQRKLNEIKAKLDEMVAQKDVRVQLERYCNETIEGFEKKILYRTDFSIYKIYVYSNCRYYVYENKLLNLQDIKGIQPTSIKDLWKKCVNSANITFLLGSPGLGKSSFSKVLFKDAIQEGELIPIHIELRDIEYRENFEISLTDIIKIRVEGFQPADFKSIPFLLILDGFDELDMLAKGKLGDFFYSMLKFHNNHPNVKIFVTGRPTALANLIDAIPQKANILVLDEFNSEQINEWICKWVELNRLDRCPLSGEEIENKNIHALVCQPLLLHLLCSMDKDGMARATIGEIAQWERWQFYGKLMDWTCGNSKCMEDDDLNLLKGTIRFHKLSEVIRELNKNIALSMCHTGREWITCKEVNDRELFPSEYFSRRLSEDEQERIISTMLVQSYMNPAKGDNAGKESYAVEFVHKSFGEYLAAEAMVEELIGIMKVEKEREYIRNLAGKYYRTFGGFKLTKDIINFLFPILKQTRNIEEIYERLKDLYCNFYLEHKFINDDGCRILDSYFIQYTEKRTEKLKIECYAGYNLILILAELGRITVNPFRANRDEHREDFFTKNYYLFKSLNEGIELSDINFSNTNLGGANLRGANLTGINLRWANLSGAELIGANLNEANLAGACLNKANLNEASFAGACLNEANLNQANLNVAYLNGADLGRANLREAHLIGADLRGADLRGTDLREAHLIGADLRGADLRGAYLRMADLSEADLDQVKIDYDTHNKYKNKLSKGKNFDRMIIVEQPFTTLEG